MQIWFSSAWADCRNNDAWLWAKEAMNVLGDWVLLHKAHCVACISCRLLCNISHFEQNSWTNVVLRDWFILIQMGNLCCCIMQFFFFLFNEKLYVCYFVLLKRVKPTTSINQAAPKGHWKNLNMHLNWRMTSQAFVYQIKAKSYLL